MNPNQSEPVQQATLHFLGPVAIAYLVACACWLVATTMRPAIWPKVDVPKSNRPRLDLMLVPITAAAVLLLGQAYRRNLLIPHASSTWGLVTFNLNNLIIYSPIAMVLILRRQPLSTVFLSTNGVVRKLLVGLILTVPTVLIYLALRGELDSLPSILRDSFTLQSIGHFPPVFLEGVGIAFAFQRLRWVTKLKWAILIPAGLFAAAHIPRQLDGGSSLQEMAVFFVVNGALTASIIFAIQKSRDIIWIGVIHYFMDVAIHAFE